MANEAQSEDVAKLLLCVQRATNTNQQHLFNGMPSTFSFSPSNSFAWPLLTWPLPGSERFQTLKLSQQATLTARKTLPIAENTEKKRPCGCMLGGIQDKVPAVEFL